MADPNYQPLWEPLVFAPDSPQLPLWERIYTLTQEEEALGPLLLVVRHNNAVNSIPAISRLAVTDTFLNNMIFGMHVALGNYIRKERFSGLQMLKRINALVRFDSKDVPDMIRSRHTDANLNLWYPTSHDGGELFIGPPRQLSRQEQAVDPRVAAVQKAARDLASWLRASPDVATIRQWMLSIWPAIELARALSDATFWATTAGFNVDVMRYYPDLSDKEKAENPGEQERRDAIRFATTGRLFLSTNYFDLHRNLSEFAPNGDEDTKPEQDEAVLIALQKKMTRLGVTGFHPNVVLNFARPGAQPIMIGGKPIEQMDMLDLLDWTVENVVKQFEALVGEAKIKHTKQEKLANAMVDVARQVITHRSKTNPGLTIDYKKTAAFNAAPIMTAKKELSVDASRAGNRLHFLARITEWAVYLVVMERLMRHQREHVDDPRLNSLLRDGNTPIPTSNVGRVLVDGSIQFEFVDDTILAAMGPPSGLVDIAESAAFDVSPAKEMEIHADVRDAQIFYFMRGLGMNLPNIQSVRALDNHVHSAVAKKSDAALFNIFRNRILVDAFQIPLRYISSSQPPAAAAVLYASPFHAAAGIAMMCAKTAGSRYTDGFRSIENAKDLSTAINKEIVDDLKAWDEAGASKANDWLDLPRPPYMTGRSYVGVIRDDKEYEDFTSTEYAEPLRFRAPL